ncbi:MAG: DMT family transporter [Rhodobiaceae bacterium]|nr:DMT family transporter [Rhodobiaceae bacterium]MCC0041058.1 DMT family transporter [Rhodobiaceae bacterium]MCC0053949.1 DMT family transporter [Rhodobiaceae bacterium]
MQDAGAAPAAARVLSANSRGILAMLLAMFGFITNDALIKLAGESLPLPMIIFVRGLIACAMIAALGIVFRQWRRIPIAAFKPLGVRITGEVGGTLLYLTALLAMPIANATAILQAMPLVMTVIAAAVLKEKVGWRRWLAVAAGFVGMLMVVQPGMTGFDSNALLAVAALAFIAMRDLSNRFIPRTVSTLMVAFWSMVAVTVTGGAIVLVNGYERFPNAHELTILTGAAVFLTIGFYFITDAMRSGEISVVAPFRYSIIVWAIVLGYFVWGDVPGLLRACGIALIVGSGLFVFYRERVRMKKLEAALKG